MPGSKLPDHLTAIVLLACVVVGCKQVQSLAQPTVLKSPDGKFQLTIPAGWRENSSLNDQAEIKAGNSLAEMYVIVITEAKADFTDETTLEHFTKITQASMMSNLESVDASPPVPLTINGNAGRQYMMKGVTKNVKLAYLITNVETAAYFHQIVCWSLQSRINKNQTTLQKITETFRTSPQVGTDGAAPP